MIDGYSSFEREYNRDIELIMKALAILMLVQDTPREGAVYELAKQLTARAAQREQR